MNKKCLNKYLHSFCKQIIVDKYLFKIFRPKLSLSIQSFASDIWNPQNMTMCMQRSDMGKDIFLTVIMWKSHFDMQWLDLVLGYAKAS